MKVLRLGKVRLHCLDIHDLIASKLAAARLKDLEFVGALFRLRLAEPKKARAAISKFAIARDMELARAKLDAVLDEIKAEHRTRVKGRD